MVVQGRAGAGARDAWSSPRRTLRAQPPTVPTRRMRTRSSTREPFESARERLCVGEPVRIAATVRRGQAETPLTSARNPETSRSTAGDCLVVGPLQRELPYAAYWDRGWAIHSFTDVPNYPASAGCARRPLSEAPVVYEFARIGTPVRVY